MASTQTVEESAISPKKRQVTFNIKRYIGVGREQFKSVNV